MSQQQWQPVPEWSAPRQGHNWSAPAPGQRWAPPTQGSRWGAPTGQPWQGGNRPYPGPPPGPNSPPWGPPGQPRQPGPQPGQFTRPGPGGPPKKSSPLGYVFGVAAAIAVLAIGGLVLASLFTGGSSDVAYQNEDYEVPAVGSVPPALPSPPRTFDEAYPIVEDNAIYRQPVASPVRCDTPDVNAQTGSAQLENALNDYMECQLRVWGPVLDSAGYTAVRPSVTVYRDQVVSACGSMKGDKAVNAFYCPADQRVFYSTLLTDALPIASRPHVIELILAHEFGHAVQGRTGIIVTGQLLAANASSKDDSLEWQRRIETQADCFSGMFMRSVAESLDLTQRDFTNFDQAWQEFGDDTPTQSPTPGNHGTGASRQLWGNRGLDTADVGQCNTFTAPATQVR